MKLVPSTLNESLSSKIKNFWKYGPDINELKIEIINLIDKLSVSNDNVRLFEKGLFLKTNRTTIEINTKDNFISLNNAKVYLSKTEIMNLYNKVLKNSFE